MALYTSSMVVRSTISLEGEYVMPLFNLIISHEPGWYNTRLVLRLIKSLLPGVRIFDTPPSLVLAKTVNPFNDVLRLKKYIVEEQTPILRAIPLDDTCSPILSKVKEKVHDIFFKKVPKNASYAIRIEGHLYDDEWKRLHKIDAIKEIAKGISNPVNLSKPDYLVLIKVVKAYRATRYACIMIAPPTYLISRSKRYQP